MTNLTMGNVIRFYSFLHDLRSWGEFEALLYYTYDGSNNPGLLDHDYWDHFVTPCPWVYKELGFIPPTPIGEIFADMSAELRVARDPWFHLDNVEPYFIKAYEKAEMKYGRGTLGELNPYDPATVWGLKAWATRTYLFWLTYTGDKPRYV